MTCGKEPEPVGGTQILKNRENPRVRYEPDALIRSQVTISGSLIDTWFLCQYYEYDRRWVLKKRTPPHMPEFSTTPRSFPGVRAEESPEPDPPSVRVCPLELRASPEGTPPMTPSTTGNSPQLMRAGRANIVTSADRKNISAQGEKDHQVYMLYTASNCSWSSHVGRLKA